MKKPIVLTVDDDPEVLQAISRDIRREYGERFRVVRIDSGERALDVVRQVKLANDPIALMLADQRMPGLTGVEFLAEARALFPSAKRALLTAYADTEAAIRAINEVHIDYYLMKPWDPPEERLYPVLDDLLDDWLAEYRPVFDGIRVFGHRWSRESHAARDFLARNQVPYRWIDMASDTSAQEVVGLIRPVPTTFPVLIFPDGTSMENPSMSQIADRVGLSGRVEVPVYDVIIVGAGPAGMAAAVYAASEGLKTLVVERLAAGGQAGMSSRIENYLGFPSGLTGGDLARRAMTQARRFGAEFIVSQEAVKLIPDEGALGLTLSDGSHVRGDSIIFATGVSYRRLNAPGVEQLTGRGIYYGAAMTEASSIRGEDIYIVGGANSAGQAAIFFADIARSVTMLVRGSSLAAGMSHYLVERIEHSPNISVSYHSEVGEAFGDDHLERLSLRNTQSGEETCVDAAGMFVFIGAVPPTGWLSGVLPLDERGFILTGPDVIASGRPATWTLDRDPFLLETGVPGIFAAGDVRHGSGKRVATAVGEGAMAIMSIWQFRAQTGL